MAVFNLVSTIIGGGVLSLPFAMKKTGLILGVLLVIFSALTSDFSIYVLIACSRRSGADSYVSLARKTMGRNVDIVVNALLFLLTFMCCIAYIVLASEIVLEIFEAATGRYHLHKEDMPQIYSKVVVFAAVLPIWCAAWART